MKNKLFKAVMLITVLIAILTASFSPFVNAASVYPSLEPGWEEIYSQDFEEGQAGWTTLGGNSKLDFDTRFSKSGAVSLICRERTEIWEGPCFNVSDLLTPGIKYNFVIFVRQDSEDDHNVTLVMKYYTKETRKEVYEQIGERSLSGNGWHRLTGSYIIPDDAEDYLIYLQHDDARVEFAIDCVLISGYNESAVTTKKKEYQEITYNFEEGINNWTVSGDALLERSSNFSHSGRYSLYTSERITAGSVPLLNVSSIVEPGISYEYSAFVMFNARAYASEHSFSLILRYKNGDGEEQDAVIDSKNLQKGNWSKLMGEFVLPEDASSASLFIQSNDTEKNDGYIAFYTDDVTIMDSTLKNIHELNSIMLKTALLIFGALGSATIFIVIFKRIGISNTMLADAASDSMTNALNRNSYEMQIAHLETAPGDCRRLWITVCDVNFLKHINDNYGHKKGDDAIIRCANVLTSTIGKKGVVYRTGGDEFICMTKSNFDSKLKEAFSVEAQQYKGYPFSVAVGTSCYLPEQDGSVPNIKIIVERSDVEMYKNKEELKKAMSGMM